MYVSKAKYHLPGLYYLIVYKNHFEKKSILKLLAAMQQLKDRIYFFYNKYLKMPIVNSLSINLALIMARPMVKLTQQKKSQPANNIKKKFKN